MEFTAEMIAGFLHGEIMGDPQARVWTIAKIEEATEGSLAFLSNLKYEPYLYSTQASIVIVNRDFSPQKDVSATLLKVDDAYGAFAGILDLYARYKPKKEGVSSSAFIDDSATLGTNAYVGEYTVIGKNVKIGENAQIYPQVYIGDNVTIGENVTFFPGVKIYEECVIGNRVIIQSGAVIGGDGFGFAPLPDGTFKKIPQLGNVVLEDDVEIGANTCVDRATMGSTVIGKGVKLDNLIQIGHNVRIEENTVAASQVGIAGSTKVGKNCMFGGQVGIAGHLNIPDRTQIASQSGISNSIREEGTSVMGSPALPAGNYHRSAILFKKLPELDKKIAALEKEIAELKKAAEKACP